MAPVHRPSFDDYERAASVGDNSADKKALLNALKPYLSPQPGAALRPSHAHDVATALIMGMEVKTTNLHPALSKLRKIVPEGTEARAALDRLALAKRKPRAEKHHHERTNLSAEDLEAAKKLSTLALVQMLVPVKADTAPIRAAMAIIVKAIATGQAIKRQKRTPVTDKRHWKLFIGAVAQDPRARDILEVFDAAVRRGKIKPEQFGYQIPQALTGSLAQAIEEILPPPGRRP